jgi:hypothetical protein
VELVGKIAFFNYVVKESGDEDVFVPELPKPKVAS